MQARPYTDEADDAVARAQALLAEGRAGDAAVFLAAACERQPDDARLLSLNGCALLAAGRPGPAIGALFTALALQPDSAAIHAGLAEALFVSGDMEQAKHHGLEAFALAPTAQNAASLSGVLCALAEYAPAQAVAEHALGLHPAHPEALMNRAMALQGVGRWAEAEQAAQQAVSAAPGAARAALNLGMIRLRQGQFTPQTWDLYERRLRVSGTPAWLSAAPQWGGGAIAGRRILLRAEQGLGDTLQFVRYAPLVAERGARVVLAVPPALLRLLRDSPGVAEIVTTADPPPAHDLVCPLLSLPRAFGTTLDSIPPPLPYRAIAAPAPRRAPGLHVGLVWAGNPGLFNDRLRSIAPAALAGLAGTPGVQFYGLQWDQAPPPELGAIDLMPGVRDFADTAALVAGLDLVIAVDTAVAHLAATMGKPVWLLSRFVGCWRWLLDRADSPWYPSLRIIRQSRPNAWPETIERVRCDLAALAVSARPS